MVRRASVACAAAGEAWVKVRIGPLLALVPGFVIVANESGSAWQHHFIFCEGDMSVFGSLMSKILGHKAAAPAATTASAPAAAPAPTASAPAPTAAASAPAPTPMSNVDVEAVLTEMAKDSGEKLDWRHSIVDLMKLTGIDSSMVNRRALATELGYTGDLNDSAPMNIWLHKEVMRKLAENGGSVPSNLTD
jgi:pyruvate/2-oxoglutarate dehydrogenase complex dihydrolipoamide acyltransferase (E2) component